MTFEEAVNESLEGERRYDGMQTAVYEIQSGDEETCLFHNAKWKAFEIAAQLSGEEQQPFFVYCRLADVDEMQVSRTDEDAKWRVEVTIKRCNP